MNQSAIRNEVGAYLDKHRKQITRRWLRALKRQANIRPANRQAAMQLIDQLPQLFDELCTLLRDGASDEVQMRAHDDARLHAKERWRQGFMLEELFL
jgi:two-component system CheB/CheR fusion protein